MRRHAAAVTCLLTLTACDRLLGEDDPPPPAQAEIIGAEDKVHTIGERAVARDYRMSIESIKECSLSGAFKPKRGHMKLGVEVVITGTTDREVPVNPFYASLHAGNGEVHSSTLAGCDPGLEAVRVKRDDSARGWITFDAPSNANDLEMRYEPMVIGGGREKLRFSLGR